MRQSQISSNGQQLQVDGPGGHAGHMLSNKALEVRGLTKSYGRTVVVNDVDLLLRPGELFALLGPSGCGKSTILRMIAGIVPPDAGDVLIGDAVVTHASPGDRDAIMVFQDYALFPHMTVFDNVAFGLRTRRRRRSDIRERVSDVLGLVGLPDAAKKYPRQLSGGQQQRVALARALVVRPTVLLLDEPLSNLDANLREDLREEIREIQQKVGITTLFVTHDINEAFAVGDRVGVMRNGMVEQIGTPKEVYQAPSSRYVAEFIGRCNEFEGVAEEWRDGYVMVRTADGLPIWARRLSSSTDGTDAETKSWVVIVRPERITVSDTSTGLANMLPASVRNVRFLGGWRVCHVICQGRLHSVHGSTEDLARYEKGKSVVIGWSRDDCYAVPAEHA